MNEAIRERLNRAIPFAAHTGINIVSLSSDGAVAELEQSLTSINHIGTQHAGALFTLGETASGAAMASVFASVLLGVRPVASDAKISYSRIAKGKITARANLLAAPPVLLETLAQEGRVAFDVNVIMEDDAGASVAEMVVKWHVSERRSAT